MEFYDSGPSVRYDTGLRYSLPGSSPANRTKAMKRVRLRMEGKDNEELSTSAKAHGAAVDDPANGFTTPTPTKILFDDGVSALDAAILARKGAEAVLATMEDNE